MSQQEPKVVPTPLNVKFADASNLPIQHVNALGIHSGSDEFFFTLGVIVPPDKEEIVAVLESGYAIAQPVYRFAISRDSMEKFIELMIGQFKQQTMLREELQRQQTETSNEEVSRNEQVHNRI
jgi:hypothetical protein